MNRNCQPRATGDLSPLFVVALFWVSMTHHKKERLREKEISEFQSYFFNIYDFIAVFLNFYTFFKFSNGHCVSENPYNTYKLTISYLLFSIFVIYIYEKFPKI